MNITTIIRVCAYVLALTISNTCVTRPMKHTRHNKNNQHRKNIAQFKNYAQRHQLVQKRKPQQNINTPAQPQSLTAYKNSIRTMHNNALLQLKKRFNISDAEWNTAMQKSNKAKQFMMETCFSKKGKRGYHNKKIPSWALEFAKNLLQTYGIDPQSITIDFMKNESTHKHGQTINLGCAKNFYPGTQREYEIYVYGTKRQKKLVRESFVQASPAKILLNPELFSKKYTKEDAYYIIAHEVTHLVEHHAIEQIVLEKLLQTKGYTKTQIKQSVEWKNYLHALEICADLLVTFDHKFIAQSAYKFYAHSSLSSQKVGYHPAPRSQFNHLRNILSLHGVKVA